LSPKSAAARLQSGGRRREVIGHRAALSQGSCRPTVRTRSTNADLLAQIAALQAENDRLKQAQAARISLEVSEKGADRSMGWVAFPVSLYRSQWERLPGMSDQIKKFIQDNASR